MSELLKQIGEKKAFYQDFGNEVNDTVQKIFYARLFANNQTLDDLKLHNIAGLSNIPGLVVFCENDIYFYVPPTDYSIMGIKIGHSKFQSTLGKQVLCFSSLGQWSAVDLEKPSLFSRIFSSRVFPQIKICYNRISSETNKLTEFEFYFDFNDKNIIKAVYFKNKKDCQ